MKQNPVDIQTEHQLALRSLTKQILQILKDYITSGGESLGKLRPIFHPCDFKPNIYKISEVFELSEFEFSLVVFAAAREIEINLPPLCAKAHQNDNLPYPTLHLALSIFSSSDWAVYSPSSKIFAWQLLRSTQINGVNRAFLPFEIDPRIMSYLLGLNTIDSRLKSYIKLLTPLMIKPLQSLVEQGEFISDSVKETKQSNSKIQLCGKDEMISTEISYHIGQFFSTDVYTIPLFLLPADKEEVRRFIFLWQRENQLRKLFLLIDCYQSFGEISVEQKNLAAILNRLHSPLIILTRERGAFSGFFTFDIFPLTTSQQKNAWFNRLNTKYPYVESSIDEIIGNFKLNPLEIDIVVSKALKICGDNKKELGQIIWDTCKIESRPQLDELATRIEAKTNWDNLILPEKEKESLREMVERIRYKTYVYNQPNFSSRTERGRGVNALFWGNPGTGKTTGAEAIALELNLDLYRVDLSNITSKYIGETEKNLARLFDAADKSGVILLFDEGESLFSKRSEVKDSRDKYANQEVSYLLQRLEAYSGIVIITTNMYYYAIDSAFFRRIQFIVEFPFPGESERQKIWESVLPPETEILSEENYKRLSQLHATGGEIKNIAQRAAFLAAKNRSAITMKHLLEATLRERDKTRNSPIASELYRWIEKED